jgi:predicted HicB family RNase H-like nuclease
MAKRPEKATLTIPVDLRRAARAKAILEGKSLSQVVRELLELYVKGELPPGSEVEKDSE